MQQNKKFLLFLLLTKQGKPVIHNNDIDCTYIYSKHGTSDVKHFEMSSNHDYGNSMTEQKQGLLSVSSNDG